MNSSKTDLPFSCSFNAASISSAEYPAASSVAVRAPADVPRIRRKVWPRIVNSEQAPKITDPLRRATFKDKIVFHALLLYLEKAAFP